MSYLRKNFAKGELDGAIDAIVTQITLESWHNLPIAAGTFPLTIWDHITFPDPADDANLEIVIAEYSGTPNVYNITRAQEDTLAAAHGSGDRAALHYTAAMSEDDLTDAVVTHEAAFVHANIALNTTHRGSDGKNHSDVVTNTADIVTNVAAIGLNTAHRGLFAGNPPNVTTGDIGASPTTHRHDGETLQHDAVNSNGGEFGFTTTGLVVFNQSIVSANYEASNKLTVAVTNAGEIDFTAGSKKLDIENNATVSQDYSSDAAPEFADVVLGDWQLGTPTYDSVHDWMNNTQSAGRISGGAFVDMGFGVLKVEAGKGLIKTTNSQIGVTLNFDWAEDADVKTELDVALTDGATNYIYVKYNGGSPAVYSTVTRDDITFTDIISLGRVFRDGNTLHMFESGAGLWNVTERVHDVLHDMFGFKRCCGLQTAEVGDLAISITEGEFAWGLHKYTVFKDTGYDSTATDFTLWYKDHTGWVSAETDVLTHHYNDYEQNPGLVATTAQQYGVFWVYLDYDEYVHVIYGLDSYKLAAAEDMDTPVNLPTLVSDFSMLIAKIILKTEETSTFTQVNTPWGYEIPVGIVTSHDSLGNLAFADAGHTGFQAQSDALDFIAALGAIADNEFLVGTGAGTYAYEDAATAATSMGLGELTAWLDDVTLENGGAITTTQVATFAQLVLTPRATALSAVEGAMFYDSDDNNIYVCTEGA